MKKIAKTYYVIIFVIIIIANIINPTYAVETENKSLLEINFLTENDTLLMDNVDISIYKLASFENENYTIEWQDTYSSYKIDLGESSDEEIISKAIELGDFVKTNNITADFKLKTDSNGTDEVNLDNGIYLICGAETIKNDITYTPIPCIIQLPYTDENGTLIYSASIELKYDRKEPEITPPTTTPTTPTIPTTPTADTPTTTSPSTTPNGNSNNLLPSTGDIIIMVVIILILVIAINVIQILNEKRKNKKND